MPEQAQPTPNPFSQAHTRRRSFSLADEKEKKAL